MPTEVFHPPYPPNLQFSHMGDWVKNRQEEPVLWPASGPQHSHKLAGACCCCSPSSAGLLWSQDKVFPKHHEAKVLPVLQWEQLKQSSAPSQSRPGASGRAGGGTAVLTPVRNMLISFFQPQWHWCWTLTHKQVQTAHPLLRASNRRTSTSDHWQHLLTTVALVWDHSHHLGHIAQHHPTFGPCLCCFPWWQKQVNKGLSWYSLKNHSLLFEARTSLAGSPSG